LIALLPGGETAPVGLITEAPAPFGSQSRAEAGDAARLLRATELAVLEAHLDRDAAVAALERDGRLGLERDKAEASRKVGISSGAQATREDLERSVELLVGRLTSRR
jgi:hypothetical protein